MKLSLGSLLEQSSGQKILFLGRESLFTHKEAQRFIKQYSLSLVTKLEEGVVAVVEHHRLNPIEEDISYEAYDRGIPIYKLEEFERLLSHTLVDDQVLMSLRLSQDQKRLYTLVCNEHISDDLFIKLIEMYIWSEDDEDNNEDRGVVIATLRRFLEYKPNEEDLLYSPLTLKKLIGECGNPPLLHALLSFPNYRFMQKGKEWITLRETIAASSAIDGRVIEKLLGFGEEKILFYLAANPAAPIDILKKLSKKGSEDIYEALASNRAINIELFSTLLDKGIDVRQVLLSYQPIDTNRFEMIEVEDLSLEEYRVLASNPQIDDSVISALLDRDDQHILQILASNSALSSSRLSRLHKEHGARLHLGLASNPSTPAATIEDIYKNSNKDVDLLCALASNPSAPISLLGELFEYNIFEINEQLASNESMPIELLDILKIDTRLRNALTSNKTYTQSITRQLGL